MAQGVPTEQHAPDPTPHGLVRALLRGGEPFDTRVARLPALQVPAGAWPKRPFRARWTAQLNLDIRTRLTFSASGRGTVKVTIKDKVVLEGEALDLSTLESKAHRIRKGANAVIIEYEPPPTGDATFRLYWQGRDFVREPIPPKVWTRAGATPAPVERGRAVFASRRCIQCHAPADQLPDGAMPELAAKGPSLDKIRGRRSLAWVAEWIVNPRLMRPDASMPALFGHESAQAAMAAGDTTPFDIVAYLFTLGGEPPRDVPPSDNGGKIFAQLGCIGCHTRPERPADPTGDRVPLNRVGTKFVNAGALRDFLRDPRAHYPWTRMPDFKLTATEASQLAGWLYRAASPPPSPIVHSGDAARGKELVIKLGCTSCHDGLVGDKRPYPSLEHLATADWTRNCLTDKRVKGVPHFSLSGEERAALTALRTRGLGALMRDTAAAYTLRQIDALRCTSCHAFDEAPDRWTHLITETHDLDPPRAPTEGEEKISQVRPTLTWMGEKLHSDWAARFIGGELPTTRPWLQARMPAFPNRAKRLARGLAQMHGFAPTTAPNPSPTAELVAPGELLLNKDGFGCTACHGIKDTPPYATFEFAAPKFDHVFGRIRKEYYTRWMWNPTRVEHRYRMPIYATPEERITLQDEILDGDADAQFEAMWHYLQSIAR